MKKAVVILSGGLDSTVCMSVAKNEGYEIFPITFAYGQRHIKEVEQAKKVAEHYGCGKHLVVDTGFFQAIGESALTAGNIAVPVGRSAQEMGQGVPVTYVPFRNAVFLSMATAYAESLKAERIYIGVNALDYSGYPDCRPQFIRAFQEAVNLGTAVSGGGEQVVAQEVVQTEEHGSRGDVRGNVSVAEHTGAQGDAQGDGLGGAHGDAHGDAQDGAHGTARIKIETPLISLTKGEIVKLGLKNEAPLHLTTSCYQGGERACGVCDSCLLRLKGFSEAGLKDPIEYEGVPAS